MAQFTDDFIYRTTGEFFDNPYKKSERVARYFTMLSESRPSDVEALCKEAGVTPDELKNGNLLATMKVLMGNKDPFEKVFQAFDDPAFLTRLSIAKKLPDGSRETLKGFGLERLAEQAASVDVQLHTPHLVKTVRDVLSLLSFVEVEDWWHAWKKDVPGGMRVSHPNEFGKKLHLPFDHYTYVLKFARGIEEVALSVHHRTREDAREGDYFARTLIGNSRIVNAAVISELDARLRYTNKPLDPLFNAFRDNFIVEFDTLGGKGYAHHPRVLLEHILKQIENPEHAYFFLRAVGFDERMVKRTDWHELGLKAETDHLQVQTGHKIPEFDSWRPSQKEDVELSFQFGNASVDVSMYLPILRTENCRRLKEIKSLGNLYHSRVGYAQQSRLEHMVGVMHIARAMCNRFKIEGKDRIKVEVYALVHDWGHLTGSHATEDYFKVSSGFDHEEFALKLLRENKDAFRDIIDIEEIVAMFEHKDPLHDIVDGPFGADRVYYLSVDPNEAGVERDFDTLKMLTWLRWVDNKVIVDQNSDIAFQFLDFRARQYETVYFAPTTQVADAYQKKLLLKAGIKSPLQKVMLNNNGSLDFVPDEGYETEFWKFTDPMFQYHAANYPDRELSEIMRHLLVTYFRSPHATVAALKLNGYESAEPLVEIPVFRELKYVQVNPVVSGASAEELSKYHKIWRDPVRQRALEAEIAKRSGLPERHIIVASVPNMQKIAHEDALVRVGDVTKSLFDWNPDYAKSFAERASRMAGLRVAIHPQLYGFAHEFFSSNSLADIVKEVYK